MNNLPEALKSKNYRTLFDDIEKHIFHHPETIAELLKCEADEEMKIPPRLTHILAKVAEKDFHKIKPYREQVLEYMFKYEKVEAVVRNILRIFKEEGVPTEYRGRLIDFCFRKLSSFPTAVAIKVYSMMILLRLCKDVPELLQELKLIIEEYMPHGSAAFKSRGRKTLKQIEEYE